MKRTLVILMTLLAVLVGTAGSASAHISTCKPRLSNVVTVQPKLYASSQVNCPGGAHNRKVEMYTEIQGMSRTSGAWMAVGRTGVKAAMKRSIFPFGATQKLTASCALLGPTYYRTVVYHRSTGAHGRTLWYTKPGRTTFGCARVRR